MTMKYKPIYFRPEVIYFKATDLGLVAKIIPDCVPRSRNNTEVWNFARVYKHLCILNNNI